MSDMLTHWAICDDSLRLMSADARVEPAFTQACDRQTQVVRLGACTRGGGQWMHPLMAEAKQRWDDPDAHPEVDKKLAWAVGGITHQACDTVAKPYLSVHAGSEWSLTHGVLIGRPNARGREAEVDPVAMQTCSAYCDVHVFRKVYLSGEEAPFTSLFLQDHGDTGAVFEAFINTMFQRALLTAHTFKPPQPHDDASFMVWFNNMMDYIQPNYLDSAHWVKAFNDPDPALMEKYAIETKFYLDDDPIIEVVRAIHAGKSVSQGAIEAASAEDTNQSMYGQGLELSLRYLLNGTDYWQGRADQLVAPLAYQPGWYREMLEQKKKSA
ncbi:hypothetical protein [Roseivivax sp.]